MFVCDGKLLNRLVVNQVVYLPGMFGPGELLQCDLLF
jgi:hypothetical protein